MALSRLIKSPAAEKGSMALTGNSPQKQGQMISYDFLELLEVCVSLREKL